MQRMWQLPQPPRDVSVTVALNELSKAAGLGAEMFAASQAASHPSAHASARLNQLLQEAGQVSNLPMRNNCPCVV